MGLYSKKSVEILMKNVLPLLQSSARNVAHGAYTSHCGLDQFLSRDCGRASVLVEQSR